MGENQENEEIRRRNPAASHFSDLSDLTLHLDGIAAVASRLCNVPIALISLVDSKGERSIGQCGEAWTSLADGDPLCGMALRATGISVVADTHEDPLFRNSAVVRDAPFVRFFASAPLISAEGDALGCLTLTDTEPGGTALTTEQIDSLTILAQTVVDALERWKLQHSRDRETVNSRMAVADSEQRFRVLADAMPHLVWSATADGMVDYLNQGWCDFTGAPPEASFGSSWIAFLHEDDRSDTVRCWREAVSHRAGYEVEYRLRHRAGQYRWMLARALPLISDDGSIRRWIGTCTDIHEQRASSERLELLSRELNHRIKNIFAVIGGLISISTRDHPETAAFGSELRDRVLALGRAHDFVRSDDAAREQTGLRGLLRALFAPYQDASATRIRLSGDDVPIDDRSATPLALFFHELATNAAKYGALSVPEGRIEVRISSSDPVQMHWCETGGPLASPPKERGFGSRLIDMSIVRQLGGVVDFQWLPEGLIVVACIPAPSLAR